MRTDAAVYKAAQKTFADIKTAYPEHPSASQELEKALATLVGTYDTAIHENRFVVGGATEMLLCAWLRALGFQCKPRSALRTDLVIEDIAFSVKANYAHSSSVRLINVLGESEGATWEEPTFVLIGGEGLFYIDPSLPSLQEALRRRPDVLEIRTNAILELANTDWYLPLQVPRKPKKTETVSRVASQDVAWAVLETIHSQTLREHFPKLEAS